MRGNSRGQNQFTPSGGGINFYQNQNFSQNPQVHNMQNHATSPQNNQSTYQRNQFIPKQGDYLTNLISSTKQFINSTIESGYGSKIANISVIRTLNDLPTLPNEDEMEA